MSDHFDFYFLYFTSEYITQTDQTEFSFTDLSSCSSSSLFTFLHLQVTTEHTVTLCHCVKLIDRQVV